MRNGKCRNVLMININAHNNNGKLMWMKWNVENIIHNVYKRNIICMMIMNEDIFIMKMWKWYQK